MAWHVCLENRQNNLHLLMMYFITLLYRSIAAFWSSSLVSFFSAFLIIIDIKIMIIGLINDQHHNHDHFYWIDHRRQNLSPPSWPTFHFQALLRQKKLLPQQQQKITPKKLLPPAAENFQESLWTRNQVKRRRNRRSVLKVRDPQLGREMFGRKMLVEDSKVLRGFYRNRWWEMFERYWWWWDTQKFWEVFSGKE